MTYGALGILGAAMIFALLGFYLCVEARRDKREANRAVERAGAHLLPVIAAQNDRIMHLAGSTWTLPPAIVDERPAREDEDYLTVPDIDIRPEDALDDSTAGLDPI